MINREHGGQSASPGTEGRVLQQPTGTGPGEQRSRGHRAPRHRFSKVPEVTAFFWIIKILTTGMGETASDWMAHSIGPLASVPLGFVVFVVAMAIQLRSKRYTPWKYWLAVVMVSVFGTMIADAIHVGLGVPYVVSTVVFAIVLAAVLYYWHASQGTLSVHSINTKQRELYYWATVITTFALGTAAGDMTAVTFHWGYLGSAVVFAIAFAIPMMLGRIGVNHVAMFWTAYIITRPLGASIADWMGMPATRGGLGWGTGTVTVLWSFMIVVCVIVLGRSHKDVDPSDLPRAQRPTTHAANGHWSVRDQRRPARQADVSASKRRFQ